MCDEREVTRTADMAQMTNNRGAEGREGRHEEPYPNRTPNPDPPPPWIGWLSVGSFFSSPLAAVLACDDGHLPAHSHAGSGTPHGTCLSHTRLSLVLVTKRKYSKGNIRRRKENGNLSTCAQNALRCGCRRRGNTTCRTSAQGNSWRRYSCGSSSPRSKLNNHRAGWRVRDRRGCSLAHRRDDGRRVRQLRTSRLRMDSNH